MMSLKIRDFNVFQQRLELVGRGQSCFPAFRTYEFYAILITINFTIDRIAFVFLFMDYVCFQQNINAVIYCRTAYMYLRE